MINQHPLFRRWIFFLALILGIFSCNMPPLALGQPQSRETPIFSPLQTPLQTEITPTTSVTVSPTAAATTSPTAPPSPTYQPVFEPAPCEFPIPQGFQPECGYLGVPENRSQPGSHTIRLHAAIFHSRSANPAPGPVIHLAGGPGSSSTGAAGYLLQQGLDAVLEQRDLILFDQRGTGVSQPRLDCPERTALTPGLLDGSLTRSEAETAIVEAFHRCRERLVAEGIDLSAYNSAASAADVNDLRVALGLPPLNLYAVSYGTRLALTILRDHPEAVRSAVLDSAYPLQVNLYTTLAPNAERAFNVLFDRCATDPACSIAYPDLKKVFYDLVDQLNDSPAEVDLQSSGGIVKVRLDGNRLIDVLLVGLYNPSVAAQMPAMIFAIRQGDYDILRERLQLYFDTSSALGMQMAVQCNEEIPFNLPEDAYTQAKGVQPQIAAFFPADVEPLFAACREWSTPPLNPRENQPISSDRPVLILAGELDPITPPGWGRMVALDLSHASFYEFPGQGHWVTRSSRCALDMALAFWGDPTAPIDVSCLSQAGGLDFTR